MATKINSARAGLFNPVVKLLKYWNYQLPDSARLKSFAIETFAGRLFQTIGLPSLQEGLRRFFDFMAGRASRSILYRWSDDYGIRMDWLTHEALDLAGTGSNLLANVDGERRVKFLGHVTRSLDALVAAERARSHESAIKHIGLALGNRHS